MHAGSPSCHKGSYQFGGLLQGGQVAKQSFFREPYRFKYAAVGSALLRCSAENIRHVVRVGSGSIEDDSLRFPAT